MSSEPDDDDEPVYDFSDWRLSGGDEDALANIVRRNLRDAFQEFRDGHWAAYDMEVAWWGGSNLEDAARLKLTPAQFADAVIYELHSYCLGNPKDQNPENPRSQAEKDEFSAFAEKFTPWREAFRRIEDEIARIMAMPIVEQPPEPPRPRPLPVRAVAARPLNYRETAPGEDVFNREPPPQAYAAYDHSTGGIVLDWNGIKEAARDPNDAGMPIARLLLAAREVGRLTDDGDV